MKQLTITKRCERCEQLYEIPNIKQSPARELLIQFTPCPFCYYVKDIYFKKNNRSGRCLDCSIPFTIVDHHTKGRCDRCAMKFYRARMQQKPPDLIL